MVNSSDTDLHFDDRYESFGTYTVPACLPDHDIEIAFGMWLGPMVSFKVYRGKDFGADEGMCYVDISRDYHYDENLWLNQEHGLNRVFDTLTFFKHERVSRDEGYSN